MHDQRAGADVGRYQFEWSVPIAGLARSGGEHSGTAQESVRPASILGVVEFQVALGERKYGDYSVRAEAGANARPNNSYGDEGEQRTLDVSERPAPARDASLQQSA